VKLARQTVIALPLILAAVITEAQPQAGPPGVVIAEASIKPFPLSAEALGNARANESVEVRPEITAAIVAISFEEGQFVEEGAVLVRLQNSEPLADLAAAKAALVDSESQVRRSSELFKTRVVSESQLEQLEAQRDADAAAVNAAQARLDQTVIRAPFAGQLGLRRVSLGSIVSPSTVITTLDDTSRIKLDFDVPEVFLALLEAGLEVTARSAAWPELQFRGRVTTIDTRVDPVSRTIAVRALLPNDAGRLRPGMFLTVTPQQAVRVRGGAGRRNRAARSADRAPPSRRGRNPRGHRSRRPRGDRGHAEGAPGAAGAGRVPRRGMKAVQP
jgi:membrane fusion protein (multidrug efflux system)